MCVFAHTTWNTRGQSLPLKLKVISSHHDREICWNYCFMREERPQIYKCIWHAINMLICYLRICRNCQRCLHTALEEVITWVAMKTCNIIHVAEERETAVSISLWFPWLNLWGHEVSLDTPQRVWEPGFQCLYLRFFLYVASWWI